LKPENIFIASDGTAEVIKVLDFGLAKFLPAPDDSMPTVVTNATRSGILVGTPAYMSPEQLLGEDLHVLWDLWALSVTAYESLTGALPFSSSSGTDWRRAVLSGNFKALSEHLDDPAEPVQDFFTRSFADDRSKRPKSATDFFRQLEQAFG
jgi:serine/threonine-protein kinase